MEEAIEINFFRFAVIRGKNIGIESFLFRNMLFWTGIISNLVLESFLEIFLFRLFRCFDGCCANLISYRRSKTVNLCRFLDFDMVEEETRNS